MGNPIEDDDDIDGSEEALLEMLGLSSIEILGDGGEDPTPQSPLPIVSDADLTALVESHNLTQRYADDGVIVLPPELSISADHMRKLTDELVWGGDDVQADKTYETINLYNTKTGEVIPKKSLTRLEHFVDAHSGWSRLCHEYLRRVVSCVLGGDNMVLYKEKLNLKPPHGSGFAPHLDTPSLRIALGEEGPQTFCTIMVAIDDMTTSNGCLRICKGAWGEDYCVETIAPDLNGSPDAGGRAGAIPMENANTMDFEDLLCKGGSIAIFNGWTPHRSSSNTSPFPRRAVFLTYNPKREGDVHCQYYERMDQKRRQWRESAGLVNRQHVLEDRRREIERLDTIPEI